MKALKEFNKVKKSCVNLMSRVEKKVKQRMADFNPNIESRFEYALVRSDLREMRRIVLELSEILDSFKK